MTNKERIQSASTPELAEILCEYFYCGLETVMKGYCSPANCSRCQEFDCGECGVTNNEVLEWWLNKEAKDDS